MEYIIKEIQTTNEALSEVIRFLQESFPKNKKFTSDFIKWQYAENPLGAMVGFNAWDGGKIISHFAALPIDMSLYGKNRKGLLCINVATNENYRGKRLFTELGSRTIEYAKNNGYDFMIAVPNANSSHGFLKYFGFDLISPLDVKVGIGNNLYQNIDSFSCFKTWDESQLKWRLKNPTNKYRVSSKRNSIIASPISIFFKTISKNVLESTVVSSMKIGWRPFNLYIGLGANTRKGIYVNIPSFVKRPPFNLVFKDLTGGEISSIDKKDIFIQMIDLDTI